MIDPGRIELRTSIASISGDRAVYRVDVAVDGVVWSSESVVESGPPEYRIQAATARAFAKIDAAVAEARRRALALGLLLEDTPKPEPGTPPKRTYRCPHNMTDHTHLMCSPCYDALPGPPPPRDCVKDGCIRLPGDDACQVCGSRRVVPKPRCSSECTGGRCCEEP